MSRSIVQKLRRLTAEEINLCPGSNKRGGAINVCVVSPSRYHTGMSSLGFQSVYALFSRTPGICCERAFLPDPDELAEYRRSGVPLLSLEAQRPLADFDIIAFSTSFEADYLNIPLMLNLAKVPVWARDRSEHDPLIIAGGAAFLINPEPVADFIDLICIGEGEELVPTLVQAMLAPHSAGRPALLETLASSPGMYVPVLYQPRYLSDQLVDYQPAKGAPERVQRICVSLAGHQPAQSVILTEQTEFGDMFLIEVSRGCPRGCRFCTSGFVYGAFRQQPYQQMIEAVEEGLNHRNKIGLVGAAVSDYADIGRLCRFIIEKGAKVSVSSLRIDRLDPAMIDALVASGHKTISLAPEGGSQRLRDMIRKNLSEEQILTACEELISRDILNLKLYFIIGLPGEREEDLEELIRLVSAIRERVVDRARANRRLGEITLSLNPFIPKPLTPFQWCGMEPLPALERKVKFLESRLRKLPNVRMKVESLKGAYLQAFLSRGDRRCAEVLVEMAHGATLKKAARACGIDTDSWVYRTIPADEKLPWDIIGSAEMRLLRREYEQAFGETR